MRLSRTAQLTALGMGAEAAKFHKYSSTPVAKALKISCASDHPRAISMPIQARAKSPHGKRVLWFLHPGAPDHSILVEKMRS
jgi:hypothetical protein